MDLQNRFPHRGQGVKESGVGVGVGGIKGVGVGGIEGVGVGPYTIRLRSPGLYQQNLRPDLDNLEKRYSTSASTDPEHRVLQSNPMDDRDVTMQHLLGWIAAYQEEMKLMDRQGSVNMMHHVLTTMNVRQGLRTDLYVRISPARINCRKDEQLQTAAIEDRERESAALHRWTESSEATRRD
ncbi:uncharacterized protein LOC143031021 [Oratosquilla oratoria]|uniref:uncharacterized protein LOC143031021 n=1 Tax=Oratosquilla oratoria TaxID=337810 RepID=UPI003F761EBB